MSDAGNRPGRSGAGHDAAGAPSRTGFLRGVAIVAVAVVIGVLLLPSATRAPLPAGAAASRSTTRTSAATSSTTTSSPTSTTVPVAPASVHVLVANGTTTNGVAGAVTRFLGSRGYSTLTAVNALTTAASSQVYPVGAPSVADAKAVAGALGLPVTSVRPVSAPPPVSSAAGADVVVIVGPDLAARFATAAANG